MNLDVQAPVKASFWVIKVSRSEFFNSDCPPPPPMDWRVTETKTWLAYCDHYVLIHTQVPLKSFLLFGPPNNGGSCILSPRTRDRPPYGIPMGRTGPFQASVGWLKKSIFSADLWRPLGPSLQVGGGGSQREFFLLWDISRFNFVQDFPHIFFAAVRTLPLPIFADGVQWSSVGTKPLAIDSSLCCTVVHFLHTLCSFLFTVSLRLLTPKPKTDER